MTKEIQKFALPLIANNLLNLVINQLILFLAVNQSLENLAGITTIQSLLFAFGGIFGAVALAFNIEGGQLLGKNAEKEFLQLLKSSILLNLFVGLAFVLVTFGVGSLFLQFFYGFQGNMLETSRFYLLIQSPYILLTLMMFLTSNLIKIENKTSLIMWVSLISTASEIIFNLIFVRVLHLGIVGAGLYAILALLIIVVLQSFLVRHRLMLAIHEKARNLKSLIQKSIPLAGQELLEGVIFTLVFEALIARLGVGTLAIYGLCAQALTIIKMPTYMYENAITVFGSKAYGEGNKKKIHQIFKVSLISSMIFYFIFSILIVSNAKPFAHLFSHELSNHFATYLIIALICSVFFISYENLKGILQALNFEKFVLRSTFLINVILFMIIMMSKIFGMTNFTLLYILYGSSLLLLSLIFYIKYRKML
ncbi:MAG: MATE family efflux transporter [Lactococcus sp.]